MEIKIFDSEDKEIMRLVVQNKAMEKLWAILANVGQSWISKEFFPKIEVIEDGI